MIVDVSAYKANIPHAKIILDRNPGKNMNQICNLLCQYTSCPLIACAYLIAAHIGFNEETQRYVDMLCKFYGYTEITGQQELYDLVIKE